MEVLKNEADAAGKEELQKKTEKLEKFVKRILNENKEIGYAQLEKEDVVDFNHRLRILGAYNDEFCRSKRAETPTEQDDRIFKDNMHHLMKYFSDPIDKAELYREMGLFDECFKQLDLVDDEGDESKRGYKEIIFNYAKQQYVSPFGWRAE